jgi:type VI secretion system protein ImpM
MDKPGFGVFGKMPSVGDFFRVNTPPGFVQVWDDWLQRGLLQGAESLGDRWDAYYMSAPIWRFCLSRGLAGSNKLIGVLMPSVDRVGRRFPLTLMAPLDSDGTILLNHFREAHLFGQVEDLALAALDDDMTRDRLAEALADLPQPGKCLGAMPRIVGTATILTQHEGQTDLLPDLAAGLLEERYQAPSIFSTEIDGIPRMMVCEGLPTGTNLQGLFNLNAAIWTEVTPI